MVTKPLPQSVVDKSGGYQREANTFSSFGDVFRFFQPRRMKISKTSPPVLNVDVTEGEHVWDRTLLREYTVSDGVLRFVQYT